jgi:hypothetical protein
MASPGRRRTWLRQLPHGQKKARWATSDWTKPDCMLPVAMPAMFATEPLEATAVATGPGSRTNRRRRNGASVFFTNYIRNGLAEVAVALEERVAGILSICRHLNRH